MDDLFCFFSHFFFSILPYCSNVSLLFFSILSPSLSLLLSLSLHSCRPRRTQGGRWAVACGSCVSQRTDRTARGRSTPRSSGRRWRPKWASPTPTATLTSWWEKMVSLSPSPLLHLAPRHVRTSALLLSSVWHPDTSALLLSSVWHPDTLGPPLFQPPSDPLLYSPVCVCVQALAFLVR